MNENYEKRNKENYQLRKKISSEESLLLEKILNKGNASHISSLSLVSKTSELKNL